MTQFPSIPVLEASERLSRAYVKIGIGNEYDRRSLAFALGYTNPKSGRLSGLITNFQLYGLVIRNSDRYSFSDRFTDLFSQPHTERGREALLEAVLLPPPFRELYESFKSRSLPNDIIAWLLHRFHGEIDETQAARAVRIFTENLAAAGMFKDGIVGARVAISPDESSPESLSSGAFLSDNSQPVQSTNSSVTKNFGDGRIATVSIPIDLTQEERDTLMALIQYL